jgi:MFS family permease
LCRDHYDLLLHLGGDAAGPPQRRDHFRPFRLPDGTAADAMISIVGFGLFTFLITCLPRYGTIGLASLILLILPRFIGGIFMGGEYTSNYLAGWCHFDLWPCGARLPRICCRQARTSCSVT